MSKSTLTREIIIRSHSDVWETAKLEWELKTIIEVKDPEICLCGHSPIKKICILQNMINQLRVRVGNCCVKNFMGLHSDKIFGAIKRIRVDRSKSLNAEVLQFVHDKRWISDWDYRFSINTMRKRNLSIKQLQWRKKINSKVLFKMRFQ